MTKPVNTQL